MAKMQAQMQVEMADEVLAQFAQVLGGETKGANRIVVEIKEVGGRMEIRVEPTEEPVAKGAGGAQS
jgi:hypothetical protein